MQLFEPIIHWPAKLPEVDAAWHIPAALLRLGWCLVGDGQVSSWCWGRAGLFPAAGWCFGKVGAGSYCILGIWKSYPLGEAGPPGVMLGGWKTKLKIVSLGNGAGVEQKQPLLSIVPPLGVCRERDGPVHPARWSAASLGAFVTLHAGVQQRTDHPGGG